MKIIDSQVVFPNPGFVNVRLTFENGITEEFTRDDDAKEWGFCQDDNWEHTEKLASQLGVNPSEIVHLLDGQLDRLIGPDRYKISKDYQLKSGKVVTCIVDVVLDQDGDLDKVTLDSSVPAHYNAFNEPHDGDFITKEEEIELAELVANTHSIGMNDFDTVLIEKKRD